MHWKGLVSDLLGAGYSQNKIAQELDTSQSWVADIVRERYSDLKWSDGQKLIRLHKRVMRKQRTPEPSREAA